jgi:hypothetical protein
MQKLLTVYLDNHAYVGDKWLVGSFADKHSLVEEHLKEYMDEGWKIVSVAAFGGADQIAVRGWLAVVIEK